MITAAESSLAIFVTGPKLNDLLAVSSRFNIPCPMTGGLLAAILSAGCARFALGGYFYRHCQYDGCDETLRPISDGFFDPAIGFRPLCRYWQRCRDSIRRLLLETSHA